ncbi:ligase-associated DNA damage response endonuclease PdeM [Tabrizicola sp. J26]|uniref:ligase-associated DNA damage response endonuclease PdeM n=1 Tax=Alitabrizicola rongguiensis TaxID=2909234 RepID=UPI001F32C429|nr:ligase-associated DNA damage response endonuclease PdeM [Tabrizicola rongguiensis]MCF1707295.1 ligase-associated DNA damage response endonuclease PdeM [Tabrizicola rongguiensis]
MNWHDVTFTGQRLRAFPSGALFWPEENLLCVSDLHLGKSERLARRGGALLPPYETRETLARLDADLAATGAVRVVCLGDSFDDSGVAEALAEEETLWLLRMMAGRDWTWIAGNHDPAPLTLGGEHRAELRLGPLTFRHIAEPPATGEVSGHYHPKASLAGQSRPCFLIDTTRIILPAYGAYTGGLRSHDPALTALMDRTALAILTGTRCLVRPMPR